MKTILNRLIQHETLSKVEAKNILVNISNGSYNPSQIASFLTVFMMRSITIEELAGFREALLELCVSIDLKDYETIDLCGTGGDGKDTFNISTLASFVTAGAGIHVAKHGNYGVSSISGSSNVMETLGAKFSNNNDFLQKCVDEAGICVLHAPLFHPAMKNVAPIRKELAVKTFFNMLGPMVNPSFPKHQLVGVFSLELARMYAYLYQHTETNFTILHSLDGYDEISLTGNTKLISKNFEQIIKPEDFNVAKLNETEIQGGTTIEKSAETFLNILSGKGTEAQNNVVCANAGMAIATVKNCSIIEGFEFAKESLLSGKALGKLKTLQAISNINFQINSSSNFQIKMNLLDKIIIDKRREVELKKQLIPTIQLENSVLFGTRTYSLSKNLRNSITGIIAEHKRRSPSKSVINNRFSVEEVVIGYQNAGVSGISVLTDGKYFGGSLDDLLLAKAAVNVPLLRKDFIIDEYQILEAKAYGADVILLISAVLTREKIKQLSEFAHSLGLEVLLEVHNREELEKAIMPSLNMIGVNNRNLKTFEVSLNFSNDLAEHIPDEFVKISESGISSIKAIKELQSFGYQGFLIGENFMKTENPGKAAKEFLKALSHKL